MPNRPHKKPKKPEPIGSTGGIYEGEAGAHAAKTDPLGFYNAILAGEGRTAHTTASDYWDFLQNQGFAGFTTDYANALAGNEQLTMMNWASGLYGGGQTAPGAVNPFAGNVFGTATPVGASVLDPQRRRQRRRR